MFAYELDLMDKHRKISLFALEMLEDEYGDESDAESTCEERDSIRKPNWMERC